MKLTLTKKIGLVLLPLVLAALSSIGIVVAFFEQTRAEALFLNLAGRQRMLAAELRSWSHMVAADQTVNRAGLQIRVAAFDDALLVLRGDRAGQGGDLGTPPPDVLAALTTVGDHWSVLKPKLDLLLTAPPHEPVREELFEQQIGTRIDELQAISHQVVVVFEAHSQRLRARILQLLVALAVFDLLVFVVGLIVVRRYIVRPVVLLGEAATRIGSGEFDHRLDIASQDELAGLARTFNEMTARVEQLGASEARYRLLFQGSRDALMTMGPPTWHFTSANPATIALFGAGSEADFLGRSPESYSPERQPGGGASAVLAKEMIEAAVHQGARFFDWTHTRLSGESFPASVLLTRMEIEGRMFLQATIRDETEVKRLRANLGQAERMASLGTLAAGVAHEINTPVQFVRDSVCFVKDAVADLAGLITRYQAVTAESLAVNPSAAAAKEASDGEEEVELTYLLEHVPKAIERAIEGLERIANIVRSMKDFAHPDREEKSSIDLNRAILSTLTVARHEFKDVADAETDLADLPNVTCHAGQLNQVILSLIVNAAHAMADVVGRGGPRGRLTLRTRRDGDDLVISIADTGGGVPEDIRGRIFEPFFTTKPVGRGTGQGLAIARSIVVDTHGGRLTFESEIGKGTTFFIRLPISGRAA